MRYITLPRAHWRVALVLLPVVVLLPIGFLQHALRDEIGARPGLPQYATSRYSISLGIGMALAISCVYFGHKRLRSQTLWIYATTLFLLILTAIPHVGVSINGARRWLSFGPLSLQPSLLLLLVIPLVASSGLTTSKVLVVNKTHTLPLLLLLCVPLLVQPNFGMAMLCALLALFASYINGVKKRMLLLFAASFLFVVALLLYSNPNRLRRIFLWHPQDATEGSSYQLNQSLAAFASGGAFGQGPGNSRQAHYYLPAWHSDFNFAIVGEEWGAVTCILITSLFLLPIVAVTHDRPLAKCPDVALPLALAVALLLEAYLHIAINLGLWPESGIPLPFVSAGSSHIIVEFVIVGLIASLVVFDEASNTAAPTNIPATFSGRLVDAAVAIVASLLMWRICTVCFSADLRLSSAHRLTVKDYLGTRGTIWIRSRDAYIPVAISRRRYEIGIDPSFTASLNPSQTALTIAGVIGVRADVIKAALTPSRAVSSATGASDLVGEAPMSGGLAVANPDDKAYRTVQWKPLEHDATAQQVTALDEAKHSLPSPERRELRGTYYTSTYGRVYPFSPLASHIVGYCNSSGIGCLGIERGYDFYLHGTSGYSSGARDGKGSQLGWTIERAVPPTAGADIFLSLEFRQQQALESLLRHLFERYNAPCAGLLVATEPRTISAYASYPTYDQNSFRNIQRTGLASQNDNVINLLVEIGPVARVFLAAMSKEFSMSLNPVGAPSPTIDAGLVSLASHRDFVRDCFLDFGFLSYPKLGVGSGSSGLATWKASTGPNAESLNNLAQYGLGLAVTPFQLANAVATLQAGGEWRRLRIVDRIGQHNTPTALPAAHYVVSSRAAREGIKELSNANYFFSTQVGSSFVFQAKPAEFTNQRNQAVISSVVGGATIERGLTKMTLIIVVKANLGSDFSLRDDITSFIQTL